MTQNKRVIFLSTGLSYGGAETQVVHLATRLRRHGWRVGIVSMTPPQAYVDDLRSAGVTVESLNMRKGVPNPKAIIDLAAIIRAAQPDILHSHMVHANLLARVARPFFRVPVLISTAHNIDEGGRWRELAYRLTDPLCDLTSNVSQAAVDRYVHIGAVPKHKIQLLPNGVDTGRFQPNSAAREHLRNELGVGSRFTWLAVGRFDAAKDHPTLLRAFDLLRAHQPDAVLLLVGQGPLEAHVRQEITAFGLHEHVRLLGVRRDIPQLMSAADAYVMSSAWEGMPMVLLEAAATGLAVVATDVGGNGEVVLDGSSGFLTAPHDPAGLSAMMLRLMALPYEERRHMGQIGRQHVCVRYDLERVVAQWETLYTELSASA